jgi:outer membrane lipoprotein-sorting protein
MKPTAVIHLKLVAVFLTVAALAACSAVTGGLKEPDTALALDTVERLKRVNRTLTSFKGIGKIRIRSSDRAPVNERVAWVGSAPEKLRIAVVSAGRPVLTIAADGRHLYVVDPNDPRNTFTKISTQDADLQRLLTIPLKSSDVVTVLSGRVPIAAHGSASLVRDTDGSGNILVLRRWWRVVEKIFLDDSLEEVQTVEMYDLGGGLRYRVNFRRMQEVDGYRVPRRLEINREDGSSLRLDIERYFAGVAVTPELFVIEPPETK